jgi:hypothetical protein
LLRSPLAILHGYLILAVIWRCSRNIAIYSYMSVLKCKSGIFISFHSKQDLVFGDFRSLSMM